MSKCSICRKTVENENAPILAMGGYGNPRYLCGECAADIDASLYERDVNKIEISMKRLSDKLANDVPDDKVVIETMKDIFTDAGERARKIKNGEYDFSVEENELQENFSAAPIQLTETEEDIELDRRDAERAKKLDKIFNWTALGIGIAALIVIIITLIK